MSFKVIVSCLLIVNCCFTSTAQTVDEVISKYIAFTGGEKKWSMIKSIVTSGIYNYGGIEFPFKTYSKTPNLYKVIVPLKGKYYIQAFDGKNGWKIDAFKNETKKTMLTGKEALAMSNEADVELENAFIHYQKKGHQASLEGTDTVQGTSCFKVKLVRKNSETETYFFSVDNFELVKKQAVSKNVELENSILDTFYSDYHVVQGLKIPFKSVSKSNNQSILAITVRKVAFNVKIPDSDFLPYP